MVPSDPKLSLVRPGWNLHLATAFRSPATTARFQVAVPDSCSAGAHPRYRRTPSHAGRCTKCNVMQQRHREDGARNSPAKNPDAGGRAFYEANPIPRAPSAQKGTKMHSTTSPQALGFQPSAPRAASYRRLSAFICGLWFFREDVDARRARKLVPSDPKLSLVRPGWNLHLAAAFRTKCSVMQQRHREDGARNSPAKNPDAGGRAFYEANPIPRAPSAQKGTKMHSTTSPQALGFQPSARSPESGILSAFIRVHLRPMVFPGRRGRQEGKKIGSK